MRVIYEQGDRVKCRSGQVNHGLGVIVREHRMSTHVSNNKYFCRFDDGTEKPVSVRDLMPTFWKKQITLDNIYWVHPEDHYGRRLKGQATHGAHRCVDPLTGEQAAKLCNTKEGQVTILKLDSPTTIQVFIPQETLEASAQCVADITPELNLMRMIAKMQQSLKATPVEDGFIAPLKVPALHSGSVGKYNMFRDLFFVVHLKRDCSGNETSILDMNSKMCLQLSLKDKNGWEVGKIPA